ncbi:uncharacterized protein LOC126884126 [Diabrotica virgifera virgifera]|uniref:Gustatory receptor n=1 Tax=Diabrotica virgifera virgifera TaxID=50390 RepID=A0ABM5K6W5_DIAVI|nr:uncharacterized protein LOC126884126 [Diabrotica virgifera virgifera]
MSYLVVSLANMFEVFRVMKSDVQIFKFIVKVGKYWGPFPIEGNLFAKICYFAISLVISLSAVMSTFSQFTRAASYLNLTDSLIFFCNLTILLIHHFYCSYYGKWCKRNSWNYFYQNMTNLDEFSTDRNIPLLLLKIICMLAIVFYPNCAILSFGGFQDYETCMNSLATAFWLLSISQFSYLVVVWCETCNILSSRYKYINNTVKKIHSGDICVRQKSMKEIINVVAIVHKTVNCLNEGAGFLILALLVTSFVIVCQYVNLILMVHADMLFFDMLWYSLHSVSFIVLSIIVIMSCDQVEKKSTEFIQTCIYIQATTGDEQAATLANLANQLRPKFSAAGFFDINQRLLPVFFSNLSTYLIIILQFKISSL